MIERVSLDNLGSFVNFEWRPGPLAILIGANGSGKSNLLDKLGCFQQFVLPGFLELHAEQGYLCARFGDDAASETYRFDELSEGQRALIALYVLRYAVAGPGKTLVIDEPDNYVSLREIQPWLTEMTDLALATGGPQVWIISHHPEVLNLLAVDHGWKFFRAGTGPTRVERFRPASGMDAAETVARGWDDAPPPFRRRTSSPPCASGAGPARSLRDHARDR